MGPLLLWFGCLLSVLMLSAIVQNQFASDGAGLTLLFLLPLTMQEITRGKVLAHTILVAAAALPCLLLAIFFSPHGSLWLWLAALAAFAGSFCFSLPLGVALSALFPSHSNLSKLGREGNAHPAADLIAAALVSTFFSAPFTIGWRTILPVLRPEFLLGVSLFWGIAGCCLVRPLLRQATLFAQSRREYLARVATGC